MSVIILPHFTVSYFYFLAVYLTSNNKSVHQFKFILPERIIKSTGRKRRKTLELSESAAPSAATYHYQTGTMHLRLKHSVENIKQSIHTRIKER